MQVTYASMDSVFSWKLKDLHTWNNCSLVLPILEYCCQNKFCNPCQSTFIASNEWYHNLASLNRVMQNLWTSTPSTKWCAVILLLVQSRWASASSSGFPENSGLKWDQFRSTICCPCCEVGHDALATIVGPIVLLEMGLEGEGWTCWNTSHLVCHILLVINTMLYATLMYYAICPYAYLLFSNLLKHLQFTLTFTFLCFLLQLLWLKSFLYLMLL